MLVHRDVKSKQIISWAAVISSLSLLSIHSLKAATWKFHHLKSCGDPVQSEHLHWDSWDLYAIQLRMRSSFANILKMLLLTPIS